MTYNVDDEYVERLQTAWTKAIRNIQAEVMNHRDVGLTGPQFHMLKLIANQGTCNASFLAEMLDVKPSAITVMTDRLVQNGYVERNNDENDRRAVLLSITEQGDVAYRRYSKKSREVLESYLIDLNEEERTMLLNVIEKFANRVRE